MSQNYDNILRDFDELEPLDFIERFDNDNDCGYVSSWLVRIAYNHRIYHTNGGTDTPIIEFYDLESGEYVRHYYIDEFLLEDEYGSSYGHELLLDYQEPSWSLTAKDADEIRDWCANISPNIPEPTYNLDSNIQPEGEKREMSKYYDDGMLRDFEDLEPLGYMEQFENDNDSGFVYDWLVRLVYNHRHDTGEYPETPIIEFYSLDSNQFVADYFVDTFLGLDGYGNGYGSCLCLDGGVPRWSIEARDADEIREWCENALYELGDPYPFLEQ